MHDDLSNETVRPLPLPQLRRRRRGRPRQPLDLDKHAPLFHLITVLRAASAGSLFTLHFKALGISQRTAMRRLHVLVEQGYLAHVRLERARRVYHLTPKSIALSPRLVLRASSSMTATPADRQAIYCHVRSQLWAALAADGWRIGRNLDACVAIRRYLVDDLVARVAAARADQRVNLEAALRTVRAVPGLIPPNTLACSRCRASCAGGPCSRCRAPTEAKLLDERFACRACHAAVPRDSGDHTEPRTRQPCACRSVREVDVLRYDVAWGRINGVLDVRVLFVDDPSRSVERLVRNLPLVTSAQRSLPLILRHTDPHSRWDPRSCRWASNGRRKGELERLLAAERVTLVEYKSEIQAYFVGL